MVRPRPPRTMADWSRGVQAHGSGGSYPAASAPARTVIRVGRWSTPDPKESEAGRPDRRPSRALNIQRFGLVRIHRVELTDPTLILLSGVPVRLWCLRYQAFYG